MTRGRIILKKHKPMKTIHKNNNKKKKIKINKQDNKNNNKERGRQITRGRIL